MRALPRLGRLLARTGSRPVSDTGGDGSGYERVAFEAAARGISVPGGVVVALGASSETQQDLFGPVTTHLFDSAASVADIHGVLSREARVDLLVDLRWRGTGRIDAIRQLLPHLSRGGTWLVGVVVDKEGRVDPVRRLARLWEDGAEALAPGWRRRVGRCVDGVVIAEDHVSFQVEHPGLLTIRDETAQGLLATREPDLAVGVLAKLAPGQIETTGLLHHYGAALPHHSLPEVVEYPAAYCRQYESDDILLFNASLSHGRSLLPESFRWHLAEAPRSPGASAVAPDLAHLGYLLPGNDDLGPVETLEGHYFHLDYANSGHYGHLMTEALSRLWAWPEAKAADPDLKILVRLGERIGRDPAKRPERLLFDALGIAADDVVWFDRAVRVRSLVGSTPLWHNAEPFYVHPEIRTTWARLGDPLATGGTRYGSPERIFVTRHEKNRYCRNVEAVEALFASHGWTVVKPGALPLTEQAALFAGARAVAGFGGTGMFNLTYARDLEALVVLNHTAYDSRNEHLYAAAYRAEAHFFWSEPDRQHPPGGFDYEAFQSPWEFDLDRHRTALGGLLSRL